MTDYYLKYIKYKTKYLNLKGGKYLSEGVEGVVFRPPLLCKERDAKYETDDYVGKIMTKNKAEEEYQKSNIVKELDPLGEWSVTIDKICEINNEQTEKDYNKVRHRDKKFQLISKFGGITLNKLINFVEDGFPNKEPQNIPLFFKLIKTQLVPIIKKLNENNVFHNDLHLDNVLYSDGKIKIFDFGKLEKIEPTSSTSQPSSPPISPTKKSSRITPPGTPIGALSGKLSIMQVKTQLSRLAGNKRRIDKELSDFKMLYNDHLFNIINNIKMKYPQYKDSLKHFRIIDSLDDDDYIKALLALPDL